MGQDLPDRTSRDQEIDVSTPGSGPQPPEQDPRQPGQPAGWGQQPPARQPYPGQPQPVGPPHPARPPPAARPSRAQQPWGAPQGPAGAQAFGQPEQPQKRKRKWLPIV